MDLKHMRAFVAVAERLSFRLAAEQLHVTQPALSMQIKDLESVVGKALLTRGRGQKVRLTQSGRTFLEGALATLRNADVAITMVKHHGTAHAGSLSFGFTDDFFTHTPLMDVLAGFHADYPDVLISYCVDISYHLVRMLHAQQLDAALLCFPLPMPAAEFELKELPPMPMVVAVPEGHPLAAQDSVWMRDLRRERFVMFPTHVVSGFSTHVARLFAHAGFSPHVAAYANSTELLARLVARNLGLAVVTRCALPPAVPGVELLSIRDSQPTIDTGLLRPAVGFNRFADELCLRLLNAFEAAGSPGNV